MNYFAESLYILFAFILLLVLLVHLNFQMLRIYEIEKQQFNFSFNQYQQTFNSSTHYEMSQFYTKKKYWIEAIQILQVIIRNKQLDNNLNKYSFAYLFNAIGYIYRKSLKHAAAAHYFQLALAPRGIND